MVAKLRLISHNLQIEMGRRTNTPRENRLCHCNEAIEDETHFLTKCISYIDIRRKHMISDSTSINNILGNKKFINYISELQKFTYIHTCMR